LEDILSFRKNFSIVKGVGDDAAVIKTKKEEFFLFTCDMLIEGKHFQRNDSPFWIGSKAINCSISDIVAMGGLPKYALVSLGIPNYFLQHKAFNFKLLYQGIKKAADKAKVAIIGGDINSSEKLIVDVMMVGKAESNKIVFRDKAKIGDYLFVTGKLGGSIRGRHLHFAPRIKESQYLVNNFKINSMIDISDGLLIDLWRILKKSAVSAVIFEELIPIHKDAKNIEEALSMGEDFELLFSVTKDTAEEIFNMILSAKLDFQLSFIGKIIEGNSQIFFVDKDNRASIIQPKGFVHF